MIARHTPIAYSWKTPKSQETRTRTSWVCMALRSHDMRVVEVSPKRRSVRSALSSMVAGTIRGKQAGQEPLGSAASVAATDLPGSFDGSAVRAGGLGMGVAQVSERRLSKPEVAARNTQPSATASGQRTPLARTTFTIGETIEPSTSSAAADANHSASSPDVLGVDG